MAVDTQVLPPRYETPRRIGRGAMGDIYLATDQLLGREVAVKLLAERYAADPSIRERFKREARAAARLSGEPGAVTVFDVGDWDGRPFIVMEHLGGGSLEDRLRREGAQPPARALRWLEQAAVTLDAAHRNGVVHRDVKPANLLLDRRARLYIADFGIASAAGLDSLTMTGTVLGTAGYLSPEQARGEHAGPASDVYALGIVAYELLTGHRPFESDSVTAEATAHATAPIPSISARSDRLPPQVDDVFERVLAKNPGARYTSASEFVADLRRALAGSARDRTPLPPSGPSRSAAAARRHGRRRLLLPAALLALAALAGAALAALIVSGNGGSSAQPVTRTIVRTVPGAGGKTTVKETVTQTTTAAAPAPVAPQPPPPAAPPPPPPPQSSDGHTLNDQGYSLMQKGNYTSALPLLQQAVQSLAGTGPADPYEGYANYNLGYTLYKLGRCAAAVPYLKRAEQLEPDRTEPKDIRKRAQHC